MPDYSNRRVGPRIPVEMWVEERSGKDVYYCHAGSLSLGGLHLENAAPHVIGTVITLAFTLPGDDQQLVIKGEVVSSAREGDYGTGIRFVELPPLGRERLWAFVSEAQEQAKKE
ncbi:MAG: PilZ domain-containing protein [Myxococcales bacterium]|nr:PilZ domain-containing protein [Myxococcales bacterium]